jgi:hypothetical protein
MNALLILVATLLPTAYCLLPTECIHDQAQVGYWKQAEVMPGQIEDVKEDKLTGFSDIVFVTRLPYETHIDTLHVDTSTKIYTDGKFVSRAVLPKQMKGVWLAFYCSRCKLLFQLEKVKQ